MSTQILRLPNFNPDQVSCPKRREVFFILKSQASGVLHIRDTAQITDSKYLHSLDTFYQKRIEALQSVDDLVAQVVQKLKNHSLLDNTYIIYSPDNGYHIGQHRMAPGKKCAFEEDINVPLIIRGSEFGKGQQTNMVTSHVDLAPTIMNLVGIKPEPKKHHFDGQGLTLPLLSQDDLDCAKEARGEQVNVEMWGSFSQEGFYHPGKSPKACREWENRCRWY